MARRVRVLSLVTAAVSIGIALPTAASTISWTQWGSTAGGNNHLYAVQHAPQGITWTEANAAANAMGNRSHLAAINSSEEDAFIFDLIKGHVDFFAGDQGDHHGPWLGGFQEAGSIEPDQGWRWVTGEPFEGFNWAPGEPNNTFGGPSPGFGGEEIPFGSAEDFLHYKAADEALLEPLGWNDIPDELQMSAYVVEAAPIPVPASILVMLTGLAALTCFSKRRLRETQHG